MTITLFHLGFGIAMSAVVDSLVDRAETIADRMEEPRFVTEEIVSVQLTEQGSQIDARAEESPAEERIQTQLPDRIPERKEVSPFHIPKLTLYPQ